MRPPQLPDDIRALLAEARPLDEPSAADRERIGRALAQTLGAPAEAWLAQPELATAKATLFGAKLLGLLAVLSVATVGTWVAVHERPQPTAASERGADQPRPLDPPAPLDPQLTAASAELATSRASSAPRPAAPASNEHVGAPATRAQSSKQPAAALPRVSLRKGRARAPDSSKNLGVTAPVTETSRDEVELPTNDEHVNRAPDHPRGSELPSAPPRAVLQEELGLITAASRALDAHDLQGASQALRAHTERFAAGFLREEREALRVILACERNDADADTRRDAFEQRYARSPERPRIAQHCDHAR